MTHPWVFGECENWSNKRCQKTNMADLFLSGRCLNEAADLELDEHAEAGVTLVEELLTDFLQVSNHRSRWHSQLSEDVSRVYVQLSLSPIPTGGQFLFTKEHF